MKKTLAAIVLCVLALTLGAAPGHATKKSKELFLFIWSEYIPDSVLADFEKETGIKVTVTTYDSSESMFSKLKLTGGKGYDIVVPSADYVMRLGGEGLLQPLDHKRLTNLGNIAPKFLGRPFDPENRWSIPYMWGSTALAVNSEKIDPKTVQSWADLWRPEFKGRLLLPNDMRGVLGIGLKLQKHSLNTRDAAQIKEAYEKLRPLMDSVKVFDSDSPKQAVLAGEVDLAVMWNGEAKVAHEENPKIVYVYPKEGFSMWMDNLSIAKGAKHVDSSYAFIDFILRPDISARICSEMGYATPNKAAMAQLSKAELENPIIYPPEDAYERGEFEGDVGKAVSVYEKYWTLLKTK